MTINHRRTFKPLNAFLITVILVNICWAGPRCVQVHQVESPVKVTRYAYMDLDSVGANKPDPLWTVSQIVEDAGVFKWQFQTGFLRAQKAQLQQTFMFYDFFFSEGAPASQNVAKGALNFVYDTFAQQKTREVFTDRFVEELKKEDQERDSRRLSLWTAEDAAGDPVATWGLYKHTSGDLQGQLEIVRLAAAKNGSTSVPEMLSYISEYLVARGWGEEPIFFRTDAVGTRHFTRTYGAKLVRSYDDGNKFILQFPAGALVATYPPKAIVNGSRPLYVNSFFGELFLE